MAIQFEYSDIEINGYNILESETYNDDLLFNESYIVFGNLETNKDIHATYNLTVMGDLLASRITVNGKLTVFGNITSEYLLVQKDIFSNGVISVKEINAYQNVFANEIYCNHIYCSNKIIANTTINIEKSCEVDEAIIAYEGIVGTGKFNVKNTIVNDYFDFDGEVVGNIFEISTFKNISSSKILPVEIPEIEYENLSDEEYTVNYKNIQKHIMSIIDEVSKTGEEEDLLLILSNLSENSISFSSILKSFEKIIEYSYKDNIENIYDFLIILRAKNELPASLIVYETVSHVFDLVLENARSQISTMKFKINNQTEFAEALKICVDYRAWIGEVGYEIIMDAIFSSIGIRYTTVKKTLSEV